MVSFGQPFGIDAQFLLQESVTTSVERNTVPAVPPHVFVGSKTTEQNTTR